MAYLSMVLWVSALNGLCYGKPKVKIFSTTFNNSGEIKGLPWIGAYADLGIAYIKEKYEPWIDFSLDYVLQDHSRFKITHGSLEDDIENLMATYYYANVRSADAMAHIYLGG